MDSGEIRIRQLGYKQELRRNFTLVSNASIGFTAISILTGITGEPHPLSWCFWQLSLCNSAGHLPHHAPLSSLDLPPCFHQHSSAIALHVSA